MGKVSYTVEKYSPAHFAEWNAFVAASKNGTFLFNRNFMEYHSDRFADFSLMVFDGEKLLAVLPAHIADEIAFSHNGLTYGGLVFGEKIKLNEAIGVLQAVLRYCNDHNILKLHIKTIPAIYHKLPSEEMLYALFLADAKLVRRDSLSVYDLTLKPAFSRDRRRCIRRGEANGLEILEDNNFELFWKEILIPNLAQKHGAKPVHTLSEITSLHSKFPKNIRHFNVYSDGKIVAGSTIFITDTVAHPQYISGQSAKNELDSLDYLYSHLITEIFPDKKYFDFGISNEEQGRKLNKGLVFWKESFTAKTMVHDFYEVDTANYSKLGNVLI